MSEVTLLAATTHHPSNWAPAEGQLIPIDQNEARYDLIGTTYGGDGMHNFALPNLKDLGPGGVRYYICLYSLYPGGEAPE